MSSLSEPALPLYQRVHDAVMACIVSGDLAPGAMLPSEFDLAAQYSVSQGTARKALSKLEQSGLVERHQGKGTFVATTTPETSLFHFFRLRHDDGSQAIPQPLSESVRRRAANAKEGQVLGLQSRGAVFEIARVRCIKETPVCYETSVLNADLFPGLKDRGSLPNALYPLYQRSYGVTIVRADEQLRALEATSSVANMLAVDEGAPVLEVERRALDIVGRVVELRFSLYLTSQIHYSVSLK
ncbi:GntR family transcriptional regulator [Rhodobacteraceae bacterium nBUS_22]